MDNSNVKIKSVSGKIISLYPTNKQKNKLVELLNGKLGQTFTRADLELRWEGISDILNGIQGARKTWQQWLKVSYWKNFAQSKSFCDIISLSKSFDDFKYL